MSDSIQWKIPSLFKGINAEIAYQELHGDGQSRTPQEIVDIARNPESSIHSYFTWDDSIAAEEYRKKQAQYMERSFVLVKKVESDEKKEPIKFRLVEVDSSRTGTYQPVKFFMQNRNEHEELLSRAKIELEGIKRRYANLVELDGIIKEIDELLFAS